MGKQKVSEHMKRFLETNLGHKLSDEELEEFKGMSLFDALYYFLELDHDKSMEAEEIRRILEETPVLEDKDGTIYLPNERLIRLIEKRAKRLGIKLPEIL